MEQAGQIVNQIFSSSGDASGVMPLLSVLTMVIRFLLPALAVVILFRCIKSLLTGIQEPEVWAYMGLPNGGRVPLYHWENIIGRAKTCDVVLNYPTLSRSHCAVIRNEKGQWTAIDLGSKSGVFINGQKIDGEARFREGDLLNMGGVELALKEMDQAEIKEQNTSRTRPGRFIKPSGTLFFISIFLLLLCVQLCISAGSDLTLALPISFLEFAAVMWGYFLIIRTMRRTGFEIESLAFFISGIGLAVVATSSPDELQRQVMLVAAGVLVFIVLCWILRDQNRAKRLRWPIAILGILALGVGLVFGSELYGAKNWITIGGISLQPSEFVKIAFVFAGAASLERLFARRNLVMFIGYTGVCLGALALMSDFGTAVVFFAVFLVIAFLRSGDIATIVLSIAAAVFGLFLILMIKPYVADRFSTWGKVWDDPYGDGMQQALNMASAASGGLFGLGAGNGVLKKVAAADTDLVFGLVSEELGLIMGLCAIVAILVMALFVLRSAANVKSSFYLIAAGAAVAIMMAQIILNVFGSLDVIPFTGVTFPFLSKGGSSLIACWGLLAFIKAIDTRQNASFAIKIRKKRRKKSRDDARYDEEFYQTEDGYDEPYEDEGNSVVADNRDYYADPFSDSEYDFEGLDARYFDENYDDDRRDR